MLALEPTVVDAIWQSFAAYLPKRGESTHPLGRPLRQSRGRYARRTWACP
jgi:transposase